MSNLFVCINMFVCIYCPITKFILTKHLLGVNNVARVGCNACIVKLVFPQGGHGDVVAEVVDRLHARRGFLTGKRGVRVPVPVRGLACHICLCRLVASVVFKLRY